MDRLQELTRQSLWWLAESIRGSVVILDKQERVIFANAAAYELVGIDNTKHSILGWPVDKMFTYTGFSREVSPILKCLRTGRPHLNVRVSTDVGEYVIDATPVLQDGEVLGAVALTYNITDLEAARKESYETASRLSITRNQFLQHRDTLEWFIESSPLFIATVDKDGNLTAINKTFLKLLGLASAAEIMGKPYSEVLQRMGIAPEKSVIYRSLNGQTSSEQFRHYINDRIYDVSAYVITHPDTGEIVGAISMAADMTDKIRMDSELMRLDRLNLAGELAASIAHEIRNPMTTVRGFLQLLSKKPELEPYAKFTELMIEEIDRANDIITTYLSLSKASVETSPCNLSALITAFAPVLDAEGMMRDACIHYDLSSSSLVLVNEAEIRQMLANLVRNALEAMPDAGVVRINTQETEDGVTISVSDGGCGIPAELLSKLGTPFLTTKQQGTGLGLSVCYRIAERHNARIEVETSAKGSTFRVVFPKS